MKNKIKEWEELYKKGWRTMGYRMAWCVKDGAANLSEEDYKALCLVQEKNK